MKVASHPTPLSDSPSVVTVALVEDEHNLREAWMKLLRSFSGFTCVGACVSGEEALKQLPILKPQIVLMDIFLPRISGIECTARLKALLPDTLIMILTSVADDEMVFMALQAGADGYLLKSTRPDELETALRDLLKGGAPMTSAVARRVVHYFRQKQKLQEEEISLSAREEEVLILLSKGYANKEIASQLGLSADTIASYMKIIFKKMHVRSRTEAVVQYLRLKED
ncbi:MAG: response regulator transcription factor [Verrucomicrobiota bacterium]